MGGGRLLQGGNAVAYQEEVAPVGGLLQRGGIGDHEVAHALLDERGDVLVAVVLGGVDGEEERALGPQQAAAVVQQLRHLQVGAREAAVERVDVFCNLLDRRHLTVF